MRHVGPTLGFRVEWNGVSIAYLPDHGPGTVVSDADDYIPPGVLELCVKTFGADNVIYGSDYPHTIGDMPGCLKRVDGLAATARDKVRGRNAQLVFGL